MASKTKPYNPPSLPDVVSSIEPDIFRVLEPLKKIMDVREGRFDPLQRWITMQDLIDFGLQTEESAESPVINPPILVNLSLADIIDVTIPTVVDGQLLMYSVSTNEWITSQGLTYDAPAAGLTIESATLLNNHIELGYRGGSSSSPYIYFHSGAVDVTYDTRIVSVGGDGTVGGGGLTFTADTVTVAGHLQMGPTTNIYPTSGIMQNVTNLGTLIFGGTNGNGGAILMYGSAHGSLGGDVILESSGNDVAHWDESAGTWTFYTGSGGSKATALTFNANNSSTFGSQVNFAAGTTTISSFNIPNGAAKSSPAQGDVWATATDAFIRINGVDESIIKSSQPVSFAFPSETSANLNDITHAINTSANKIAGTTLFNSTVGHLVTAVGSADGSVWVDGVGTTINTPVV